MRDILLDRKTLTITEGLSARRDYQNRSCARPARIPRTNSGGAGLPEVLCFLALLATLAAISVPHFSALSQSTEVRHQGHAVEHLLRRLVLLAQERETLVSAEVSESRISVSGALHTSILLKRPLMFGPQPLPTIYFYPSGTVSPASFFLSGHNMTCAFIVSLRGRVRTQCFE